MSMKFRPLQSLTYLNPSSLKQFSEKLTSLIEKRLWAQVSFAMILGLVFGLIIAPNGLFKDFLHPYAITIETTISWLALPAKFFLKSIQMVVIPLILASIICGLASTRDAGQMKSLGARFSIYVLLSSTIAAVVGLSLAQLVGPGRGLNLGQKLPPPFIATWWFLTERYYP